MTDQSPINYSVLMSVYDKENPVFFNEALKSIFNQTFPTNDFVLICDGPINDALEKVIHNYSMLFGNRMRVFYRKTNQGLGSALNFGLERCHNEIVLRADSDDVSIPERAQIQIDKFIKDDVDLSSSNVYLFENDISQPIGKRNVPQNNEKIKKSSKSKNPFNHPSVIFKKSKVIESGNYLNLLYKEDYYLWIRMLQNNIKCNNIPDYLVYMRVNSKTFIKRINKTESNSHKILLQYMLKTKYIGFLTFLKNKFVVFVKHIIPKGIARRIYLHHWRRNN